MVTNAACALFLMSRAPAAARERLKEGGKVTHLLANLSKRGSETQKKVCGVFDKSNPKPSSNSRSSEAVDSGEAKHAIFRVFLQSLEGGSKAAGENMRTAWSKISICPVQICAMKSASLQSPLAYCKNE